ncbi:RagB/SusD family nutrient uptake outer membrane protein [Chitinophaga sp. sic0106]|uniref:RagB/SusD family nutrient uptake outer membrane protein n=1 Tax=Chitinophaga sp. sic0106 TaxID=2854785 RepID=UPI001C46EEE2|nr:RagB/SusD family nutrient uptake outer membrane protein [Chitinophaga sp. sic0106]MBV7530675.1 RagB/SusD family nutrient uptake outer membrane protein [Chitinophaga sp. sic0106]
MKKTVFLYILLLTTAACNKELGKLPENARVEGNTILDQRTSEIALNGVYYRFANVDAGTNTTRWRDNEFIPAACAGYMGSGYGADPMEENAYTNSGFTTGPWSSSYTLVNAANGVIEGVTALPDNAFTENRKKEILAESRFMRAYGHFRLLSLYGEWYDKSSAYGALLRTEFVTLGNIPKKRNTVQESYDLILGDVNYAIENAAASRPNYYVNQWVAKALKLRILLSYGDYAAAATLAQDIISNSPYKLETNVKDIFYLKGMASTEVLLGVQPQQNQASYYYNLSSQYYPGASSLYVAKQALKDLLNNDPRQSWLIGPANSYVPGTYYFLKYIAANTKATAISETAYAFRLTEVYLLGAEALLRSGGSVATAKNLVKEVMKHAGVTDFSAIDNAATTNEQLLQVYYEIARSLTGEDGQEWQALLRLPFATVQQLRPEITDKLQYIFPVPRAEFQQNPSFGDQNKGYQK